ncbi:MAG TPA: amino acid permease [Candidatus Acidoferrales bacterium]|nr:amino acid permease [Candidatus Acidoferrales bacterium]
MDEERPIPPEAEPPETEAAWPEHTNETLRRESGLARQLTMRHMAMIAIGGAIGTGLFLGSALAVRTAGPAVILSYALGAVIALLMMGALSEMAVAHPTAGSFGVYAELYLSRWAGFVVRYTYWAAQCIAIGGEATAAAIYCRWWFPQVSAWMWVVLFSLILVGANAVGVGSFGEFEYWFAMIKVAAIVAFILFGAVLLFHLVPVAGVGSHNYTAHGGFFPHGLRGLWLAMGFVIFSYIGTEVVAVTAGEARDPQTAVPRALRSMVTRLIIFYIGAMVVLIGVVPWDQVQPTGDVRFSPFVRVFQLIHVPAATHIMNFVVLTAALSSMNCDLYLCTRMLYSLARGGYAPRSLGEVSSRGTPIPALLVSTLGLVAATVIAAIYPNTAYVYLLGVALFGGMFVWILVFVTHLAFRRAWNRRPKSAQPRRPLAVRMPGYPYLTLLGIALLVGILVSTWWVEGMRPTLLAGLPWLALVSGAYLVWSRRNRAATARLPE